MARSYRRRPFASHVGGSQKQDKRVCNRILRRTNRVRLACHGADALWLSKREALDAWSMSQDGTRGYRPFDPAGWMDYRRWYRWVKAK